MSSLPQNPDVIVVGAGTAGLSAAKSLQEAGLEVAVLEAAAHVGGRCITDTSTFAMPFDRGGSWLHSGQINPLAEIAEESGLHLHKKHWEWERVFAQDRILNEQETVEYTRYQEAMWENINSIGLNGGADTSIEEVLPTSPHKSTAKHWVPQMLGGDADVTSTADVTRYADAEGDWLVSGGLGAFIKTLHSSVTVELNCPVSRIDYSGSGVQATTPKGVVSANYLISTVSTGVLSAETLEFTPALPNKKLQAISELPNGLLNKIGIDLDPNWNEVWEGYTADYHKEGEEFCTLLFGFFNTSLAIGFTSGRFAVLLEKEGPGSATEFCLQGLRSLFGNDVTKYVRRTTETAWQSDPTTCGSYSYALPGCADARTVLAEPVADRLFFAGEATIPSAYATVHGAYLSGKDVAEKIIRQHT